jgi:hypothetical protein
VSRNFECRLADDALIDKYNFFVFEVVKVHLAKSPKHPETLHYAGDGGFMVSGKIISRRRLFRPELHAAGTRHRGAMFQGKTAVIRWVGGTTPRTSGRLRRAPKAAGRCRLTTIRAKQGTRVGTSADRI